MPFLIHLSHTLIHVFSVLKAIFTELFTTDPDFQICFTFSSFQLVRNGPQFYQHKWSTDSPSLFQHTNHAFEANYGKLTW